MLLLYILVLLIICWAHSSVFLAMRVSPVKFSLFLLGVGSLCNAFARDNEDCDIPVNSAVPCAGAVLSVISYSFIFYLYYVKKLPTLKRHPTSLAINKSFFELLYVVQFLWVGFLDRSVYVSDGDSCRATMFAGISAFVTQFSILGAELWFLVLTMDLHLAITNPFTSYKLNAFRYQFLVYGGSLSMAIILVLHGPSFYGLSSDSSCWIQDSDSSTFGNWPKVYLFYIFMVFIYAYCLYVVLFVFRRLNQGLSDTLTTRISVVKRAQYYVLGYTFFWATPLSLQCIDLLIKNSQPRVTRTTLQTIAVGFLSSRGVFSLIILLLPNYHELKTMLSASAAVSDKLAEKIVLEEANQSPHLNVALRAEILYFTTQGIRFAVASAETEREVLEQMQSISNERKTGSSTRTKSLDSRGTSIAEAVESGLISEGSFEDSNAGRGLNRIFSFGQMSRPLSVRPGGGSFGSALSLKPIDHSSAIRELEQQQRKSMYRDVAEEENKIRSNFAMPPMLRALHKNKTDREDSRDRVNSTATSDGLKNQDSAEFRLNIQTEGESNNWSRVSSATKTDATATSEPSLKKSLGSAVRAVPKDFTFKDYLPSIFAEVRSICNIDPEEYANSFLQTTKEKFSEGRSGAFLYFSSNLKYIVKTTTEDESEALRGIMDQYVEHIKKYPNSLICRFLGAHSLTLYGRKLFFVVMLNVFSGAEKFSERYDLKGSWVHRHGENSRLQGKKAAKSAPLYKDNDLQFKISLLPGVEKAVTDQLARDTEFLRGVLELLVRFPSPMFLISNLCV